MKVLDSTGLSHLWDKITSRQDEAIQEIKDTIGDGVVQVDSSSPATELKAWVGTLSQYNAISSKDSNTLYFIQSS